MDPPGLKKVRDSDQGVYKKFSETNYRIAEETLHNRDRAWMSEYILNH
jgi:hypothetical protein